MLTTELLVITKTQLLQKYCENFVKSIETGQDVSANLKTRRAMYCIRKKKQNIMTFIVKIVIFFASCNILLRGYSKKKLFDYFSFSI